MKIYIAGPYSATTEEQRHANVCAAIDAGLALLDRGHDPFIPHLTHFVDMRAQERGISISWDRYIEWDLVFLDGCDALLFLGSSRGADIELRAAQARGKQIYRSVDEVPSANSSDAERLNSR